MKNIKGGPGSGRHSGGGANKPIRVGNKPVSIGPSRPYQSGIKPSDLYPHGRNPDGTPRTGNDIRDPKKPPKR